MQRTFLYQNGCNRSFSFIKLRLNDQTSCLTLRICLQLQNICSQQNHFQKIFNTLSGFCRYRYTDGVSAPVLCNQAILSQFLFYTFNICTWLIDLVDRNNHLYTGRFRMIDCFDSLRFHTVVCCNYKDCNIGRISTSHTHSCECFMSRSIQECDLSARYRYHICTNVLGNTASLTVCYICMADCIQKRGLTMVYMTHNTYDRCSLYQSVFRIFRILQKLSDYILFYFRFRIKIIFQCDLSCCLEVQLRVHSQHLSF